MGSWSIWYTAVGKGFFSLHTHFQPARKSNKTRRLSFNTLSSMMIGLEQCFLGWMQPPSNYRSCSWAEVSSRSCSSQNICCFFRDLINNKWFLFCCKAVLTTSVCNFNIRLKYKKLKAIENLPAIEHILHWHFTIHVEHCINSLAWRRKLNCTLETMLPFISVHMTWIFKLWSTENNSWIR